MAALGRKFVIVLIALGILGAGCGTDYVAKPVRDEETNLETEECFLVRASSYSETRHLGTYCRTGPVKE